MKALHRIIASLVVTCLLISSVGFTVVTFACPMMKMTSVASCSMCKKPVTKASKTKDCCKGTVEHKVVRTDGTRPHDSQQVQTVAAILPTPMLSIGNDIDLFASSNTEFRFHTPPLPPDASTARAMLSEFLI